MATNVLTVLGPKTSTKLDTTSGGATTTVTANAILRLVATADMFINFGTTAVLDGTNMFLQGGMPEYIQASGSNIAAKVVTGSATLYITEMA